MEINSESQLETVSDPKVSVAAGETIPGSEQNGRTVETSVLKQTVPIKRWIVFFQAGLLGVTATTFFIFGLMVGNLTADKSGSVGFNASGNAGAAVGKAGFVGDSRIAGSVMLKKRSGLVADTGAVVVVLPTDVRPDTKQDASLIMPDRFVVLDNPAIEAIHELGGAVVRADRRGLFEVLVDQNRNYALLVISKAKPSHPDRELTKQQLAIIGTFFGSPEKLVLGKEISFDEVTTDGDRVEHPAVEF